MSVSKYIRVQRPKCFICQEPIKANTPKIVITLWEKKVGWYRSKTLHSAHLDCYNSTKKGNLPRIEKILKSLTIELKKIKIKN